MTLDYDKDLRTLGCGYLYPYSGRKPADRAEQIACAILYDLSDRSGIKHGFSGIDEDVRESIVSDLAAIIRAGIAAEQLPTPTGYDELMEGLPKYVF
jgi:hypothetical protein